jgi:glycosyltransferase involved in cell wall biosynthesis/SAM-dependent methyltransferase
VNDPLRILKVADVSPIHIAGGAERVLWEHASRLAAGGCHVRILSRGSPGSPPTEQPPRVELRHYPVDHGSLLAFIRTSILGARRAAAEEFARMEADVLHCYQPLSGYGVLTSPLGRRLPSLYTFLSPAPLEYRSRLGGTARHRGGWIGTAGVAILWLIERSCLRRATHIQVLSDFSARQLWELYRIDSDRIIKIPAGADLTRFRPAPDRGAVRQGLGLPSGVPLLLTVRNLVQRMGLDTLITALSLLRRHHPEVLLLIGGTGPLRAELEAQASSLGVGKEVRFLGYVPESDLPRFYQAADCFVLPTRELEGFGLITAEALASATPVLGTPVGATPEVLGPLDPRLVFRDTTPEVMAEDLHRFLEADRHDPAAATALRQACRTHAERALDWDLSVQRLRHTLECLAARRPSAPPAPRSCPACEAHAWVPDVAYLGTPYRRCRACGTAMVSALPDPNALRECYEVHYPGRFPHDEARQGRVALFEGILDQLQGFREAGRLLDIGCSGGYFLTAAVRRGWQGTGMDLSHEACVLARRANLNAVHAESCHLPFRDGCMDAVSFVNVLDHVADLVGSLLEARRVLAPGGVLVVRVPNAAFHRPFIRLLSALGPWARSQGLDGLPILHLYGLTQRSLRLLVARAGFAEPVVKNSPFAISADQSEARAIWKVVIRLLLAGLQLCISSLECLSGGRWLVSPSLELYATAGYAGPEGRRSCA